MLRRALNRQPYGCRRPPMLPGSPNCSSTTA